MSIGKLDFEGDNHVRISPFIEPKSHDAEGFGKLTESGSARVFLTLLAFGGGLGDAPRRDG